MYSIARTRRRRWKLLQPDRAGQPVIALIAIVLVLFAAFGFYYVQSTGTISSLNKNTSSQASMITSQASQITAQVAQLNADNAKITNLTSSVSGLQSQVTDLQAQVTSDEAKITSLVAKDGQANQTISSLNSQVSSLNVQITTLNSEMSGYESQVASLYSQVASLQAVTGLTNSATEVPSHSFSTGTAGFVKVANFTISYAGYIAVNVASASDYANEGLQFRNNFSTVINSPTYYGMIMPGGDTFYPFTSQSETDICPVIPGVVSVYLATSDASAQLATLSVVYYS